MEKPHQLNFLNNSDGFPEKSIHPFHANKNPGSSGVFYNFNCGDQLTPSTCISLLIFKTSPCNTLPGPASVNL